MKYIAKIFLAPIGELYLGEFDNMGSADNACEEVGKVLRKYTKTDFRPVIYERTPYWKSEDIHYVCSECGKLNFTKTKFCPHCGVKMYE